MGRRDVDLMVTWYPEAEDLQAAFADLPDGWHSNRDLLAAFNTWIRGREGKEPLSAQKLVRVIPRKLCLEGRGRGARREWFVDRPSLQCRNWFVVRTDGQAETPPGQLR